MIITENEARGLIGPLSEVQGRLKQQQRCLPAHSPAAEWLRENMRENRKGYNGLRHLNSVLANTVVKEPQIVRQLRKSGFKFTTNPKDKFDFSDRAQI